MATNRSWSHDRMMHMKAFNTMNHDHDEDVVGVGVNSGTRCCDANMKTAR
jgi:hypothetical protein